MMGAEMKIKIYVFVLVVLLSIACLFSFNACTKPVEPSEPTEILESDRFILLEKYKPYTNISSAAYVIVDTNTGVCYLLVVESQGSGLTVMVDAAGNPLVLPEYIRE